MDEQNESLEISIPEDEGDLTIQLEEGKGRKLIKEKKNLAFTQAKLVGDL